MRLRNNLTNIFIIIIYSFICLYAVAACATSGAGSVQTVGDYARTFDLGDGRHVICLYYGEDLSCDWEHAK